MKARKFSSMTLDRARSTRCIEHSQLGSVRLSETVHKTALPGVSNRAGSELLYQLLTPGSECDGRNSVSRTTRRSPTASSEFVPHKAWTAREGPVCVVGVTCCCLGQTSRGFAPPRPRRSPQFGRSREHYTETPRPNLHTTLCCAGSDWSRFRTALEDPEG